MTPGTGADGSGEVQLLPAPETAQRRNEWLALAAVLLLSLLTVSPGLRGGFHADDWALIRPATSAEVLSTFTGDWSGQGHSPGGLYRPLVRAGFWIEQQFWGPSPLGYHVTNAALYLVFAAAVFRVALRLGGGRLGPAIFAGLFAGLFPFNAEAVSWLSGRTDLQAACLLLWGLYATLRALEAGSIAWSAISLALLAAALLTKETATAGVVIFPLAVVLMKPRDLPRRCARWLILGPLALGAAYLAVRFWAIGGLGGYHAGRVEPLRIGAVIKGWLTFVSALTFPRAGLGESEFARWPAAFGIMAAGLLCVLGKWRRPAVFGFVAAACVLLPMFGLSVSPAEGGRLLLLPCAFVALALAAWGAHVVTARPPKLVLGVVYLYVFLHWTAASLDANAAWSSAREANERTIHEALTCIADSAGVAEFVYLEPSSGDPARVRIPGMAGFLGIQALWEWQGGNALGRVPAHSSSQELLLTDKGGTHRVLRPVLAPPTDAGAVVMSGLPAGGIETWEVREIEESWFRTEYPVEVVGDAEARPTSDTLSGFAIGPDSGVAWDVNLEAGWHVLTGIAQVPAQTGRARLEFATGEVIEASIFYPLPFWGIESFRASFPQSEAHGPARLLWFPAGERSASFELRSPRLTTYLASTPRRWSDASP